MGFRKVNLLPEELRYRPLGAAEFSEQVRLRSLRLAHGNRERADEIEQQVAVRVWQASNSPVHHVRSLPAFRQGVMVNVYRELVREDRRHRHHDIHGEAGAALVSGRDDDPAAIAQRRELFRLLRRAITRLTDTSRMIVRMRYLEDMEQRQIAKLTNIHEVKISRILQRARASLKRFLSE